MKTALILACLVVMVTMYTARAQNVACTADSECDDSACTQHHGLAFVNICQHGTCHCHSQHQCTADGDCKCNDGFTASCDHNHCHCHHAHTHPDHPDHPPHPDHP